MFPLQAFSPGVSFTYADTYYLATVEARKAMLDAYPNLRGMYDENDGNTEVLYFENAKATFSSFTAALETVEF